jgi:glycerate kinase
MKIVVASDSFKGTLSSIDICHLFKDELDKYPNIEGVYLPIADGGEGSLEAIAYSLKGRYVSIIAKNPYFQDIKTQYYNDENKSAYIETASCAGLTLIKDLNPAKTTTYGLGQQVKDAIKNGCHKIYIFLGGSATNDGGCGLFAALGTKFYNGRNKEFIPVGSTLKDIVRIDNSLVDKRLEGIEIIGMCDVDNPMHGPQGAAYIYGPQKGADSKMAVELDKGLEHLANIIKKDLHIDVANIPGAGAAGGIGAGILAYAKGTLKSGIETILEIIAFDNAIEDADYVISGEGRLDEQSFYGKTIKGIAARCQRNNRKLILIVGSSNISFKEAQEKCPCIETIIETNPDHLPFADIKSKASSMYKDAMHRLISMIR